MKAAIEALPFENSKLTITATAQGQDFATLLSARLKRIADAKEPPKLIESTRGVTIEPAPPSVPDRRSRR